MKKLIILFAIITNMLIGEGFGNATQPSFVKPEDAFKVSVDKKDNNSVVVKIILAKDIYIYQDSLKLKSTKPNMSELKPTLPLAVKFHDENIYTDKIELVLPNDILNDTQEIEVAFEGCSKAGICYSPINKKFPISNQSSSIGDKLSSLSQSTSIKDIAGAISGESFGFVLLLFFVGGLLMALTPCIFPMVPILSSILVSQSSNQTKPTMGKTFMISLVYVIAMALTYATVGIIAGLIGFDMSAAMQNPLVLIAFAGVFVALAISLFGYYEIGLPSSWQTKLSGISDNAQGKGIFGTAIMGALSALIVGPCVAPILGGAILFISQTGNALLGGVALFVMSIGMGVPLLLIGLGAGKFMPRAGGWMNIVSRFFGVMMLAIALMMLGRILPNMLNMILWSALALGSAFALFKSIKTFKSLFAKSFSMILVTTLTIIAIVWAYGAFNGATSLLNPLEENKNISSINHKANMGYSVDRLLGEIKAAKQPVIVDFTKESCASCKELELITFPDPKVKDALKNYKFITVDLTANSEDDKKILAHFGVFGTPNILFFDKNGEYLSDKTITGFIAPEKMVSHIKKMENK